MTVTMEAKHRLLLIDDSETDRALVRRFLQNNGYEVETATNGKEGIALLGEVDPHCVLVDYRMPGMNGYEVARQIKAEEKFENVPVLILTGADSTDNVVEGLDSGADDFVTKSSDTDVILARVRALLRIKAYQDRIVHQSQELRRLYEESEQKSQRIMQLNERMNRDLEFARKVQESLLPARDLELPGVEIASDYLPTETLSGDFYDYFESDGRTLIFFADVSGHGVPAAILTSLLKSYLHTEAPGMRSIGGFMEDLNQFLYETSLPSQYATAQFVAYEPSKRSLEVTTAAHPHSLYYRPGQDTVDLLEYPGHLLGAMPEKDFEIETFEVAPGDILLTYSDGLTDRIDSDGEFYSIDRIGDILRASKEKDLSTIRSEILGDASSFDQTDDLADDTAIILTRFV